MSLKGIASDSGKLKGVISAHASLNGSVSGRGALTARAHPRTLLEGESAYDAAVRYGFEGTEEEWLASLKGENGKSAYEYAKEHGFTGTEEEFGELLVKSDGKSAYEYAKEGGYTGTEAEFAKKLAAEYIPANTPTDHVAIFGTIYHRVKIGDGDITFIYRGNEGVYCYCENGDGTLIFYGLSGDQSVRLENIATPINTRDAANKEYVDGKASKSGIGLGNVDNVRQYSASNPPPYPVTSVNGKTGAVTVSVPTQTSQLTNNSGYITKAVSDLANYYLKSETLTKTEINALVSAIPKFTISVVTSLPTSNISETTVYLVKSGTSGDLYTEYIYVNNAWEVLGSQKVDLTGYAKLTDIPPDEIYVGDGDMPDGATVQFIVDDDGTPIPGYDMQDIVDAVLAALPRAEGVGF